MPIEDLVAPAATDPAAGPGLDVAAGDPRGTALAASGWDLNPLGREIWRRCCRLREWTVVLDVGANYGEMLVDLPLAPGARVWAFEPAPAVADCLRRTVARRGLAVEVVELAVGSARGTVQLYEDPAWSGTTTATPAFAAPGSAPRPVGCTRLDEFLVGRGVPPGSSLLVKVDVEGGERDVLTGLLPVLPLVADALVLAEVAHTPDADLEWMAAQFCLHLVDAASLVPVPAATAADARRLLDTGRYHRQDALLALRPLDGAL